MFRRVKKLNAAFCGERMRCGYSRSGVYLLTWDTILKQFNRVACHDVTKRALQLGSRDSVTGWYAKNYNESIIEMVLIPKSNIKLQAQAGSYTSEDMLGMTADPLEVGDEIKLPSGFYYEVEKVQHVRFGDSFSHRICDLRELPLHV